MFGRIESCHGIGRFNGSPCVDGDLNIVIIGPQFEGSGSVSVVRGDGQMRPIPDPLLHEIGNHEGQRIIPQLEEYPAVDFVPCLFGEADLVIALQAGGGEGVDVVNFHESSAVPLNDATRIHGGLNDLPNSLRAG